MKSPLYGIGTGWSFPPFKQFTSLFRVTSETRNLKIMFPLTKSLMKFSFRLLVLVQTPFTKILRSACFQNTSGVRHKTSSNYMENSRKFPFRSKRFGRMKREESSDSDC
jgi:hypothetical protein